MEDPELVSVCRGSRTSLELPAAIESVVFLVVFIPAVSLLVFVDAIILIPPLDDISSTKLPLMEISTNKHYLLLKLLCVDKQWLLIRSYWNKIRYHSIYSIQHTFIQLRELSR